MSETRLLFDQGLQPERTALAWRRTALALGVGSCAALRVLPELLGPWALLPAALGMAWAAGLLVLIHRRHRAVHARLTAGDPARVVIPSGLLPLATAGFVSAAGLFALVVVLAIG